MPSYETQVKDYLGTIAELPEETRFLKSVPWVMDGCPQDPAQLVKGLRYEAARFAELPLPIRFSLITPMWNTPPRLLRELILSVRCQSWPRWELILVDDGSQSRDHLAIAREWADRDGRIKFFALEENRGISGARNFAIEQATGDFLCVLDHDDLLHPSALGVFARRLNSEPGTNLIFSNEAKINEQSDVISYFTSKPPFDLFTLLRINYICHLTAVRRDLLLSARRDGLVFRPEYDGVEDHDLFLRVALTGQVRPAHVPLYLYYWRMVPTSTSMTSEAKPGLAARRLMLLDEFASEVYPGTRWKAIPPYPEAKNEYTSLKIRAIPDRPRPSLLVVVPFKDNAALTLQCVESLERQRHDLDVRVVLVDNNSEIPGTSTALGEWLKDGPKRNRYEVFVHEGPFNFARLNNAAIGRYGQERDLFLLLNNDVELKSPDCLQTMAMQLLADAKAGFVGIKLLYPGGQEVQHGGVQVMNSVSLAGYHAIGHARERREFVDEERIAFGVTFACAMTRREVFERLGGLEEILLPNGYGDVDMCARALEAGYSNYYFGTLVGVHHESKSRGSVFEEAEIAALHERHGRTFAYWRPRNLAYSKDLPGLAVAPASNHEPALNLLPEPVEPAAVPGPVVLPLRYKIADRLNVVLKGLCGPAHRVLKLGALHLARIPRALRARKVAPDPGATGAERPIYRPFSNGKHHERTRTN